MKHLLALLVATTLTTCIGCVIPSGYPTVIHYEPIEQNGPTLTQRVDALETELHDLEVRVEILDSQREFEYQNLAEAFNNSEADKEQLRSLIETNTEDLWLVRSQIFDLDQEVANAIYYISALQTQIHDLQVRMASAESHLYVTEIVDFCNDSPMVVDEIGLRLNDGRLVVYFESGSNRRLSVLTPGNYRTTDGSNCNFSVGQNGEVY